MTAILDFQAKVGQNVGRLAAWLTDCKLRDCEDSPSRGATRCGPAARPAKLTEVVSHYRDVELQANLHEEAAAAERLEALTGHRLRRAGLMAPACGTVLMCTRCGGRSSKRVALLGDRCRGGRHMNGATVQCVRQFLNGQLPKDSGVLLGTPGPSDLPYEAGGQ